jgi:hypothetical protein
VHVAPQPAARQTAVAAAEAHTAPHDELLGVARDLIAVSSNGAVTLDALANALKARGFSRPPGSPRLITRLRRLRELSVSRSGHITLVDSQAAEPPGPEGAPSPPARAEAVHPVPGDDYQVQDDSDLPDGNRRDDRPLEARRAEVEAAQRAGAPAASLPPAAGEEPRDETNRRRRSRRGGRRHRRHGAPAAS